MSERVLASRFMRLIAFVLDWLLVVMVTVMVLGTTRLLESADAFATPMSIAIRVLIAGAIAYLILNGWLLIARGQTFGMMLCRLTIVIRNTTDRPAIWVLVIRSVVFGFAIAAVFEWILFVVYMVNWLFIVRKNRCCLHDLLLQTEVIENLLATDSSSKESPESA